MSLPDAHATPSGLPGSHLMAAELERYEFELYITTNARSSTRAVVNLRTLCESFLAGRHALQVIDVTQAPRVAMREQIIAAPTLVRRLPLPVRRFIGDISQVRDILVGEDQLRYLARPTG